MKTKPGTPKPSPSLMVDRAREHRKKPTDAEKRMVETLKKLDEDIVKKQVPIERMIVDIALPDRNLLIEVDGPYHDLASQRNRDEWKDRRLRSMGFNLTRIRNEKTGDMEFVRALLEPYAVSEKNYKTYFKNMRPVEAKKPPEQRKRTPRAERETKPPAPIKEQKAKRYTAYNSRLHAVDIGIILTKRAARDNPLLMEG